MSGDSTIQRRKAKSGRVATSQSSILHDTSRSRITLVPFYIPHSTSPDELSVKILKYKKNNSTPLSGLVEDAVINLNAEATLKLQQALNLNVDLATSDDGKYLLVKIQDGTADTKDHDPSAIANALAKLLSREDIVKHLSGLDLSSELLQSLEASIKLREMQIAVEDLRAHLNSGNNKEQVYQNWCQSHSWAFGSSYLVGDDLRNISISDNLDMLLPTVIGGYRDLVELKRPDMDVILYDKSHKNHYWSSDVSKAIGQCHRYLDVLHEAAANGLLDHPEVVAYHPRATIVVGRSDNWDASYQRALHGLNRRLSSISVMTYDQLLAQGERLVGIVSNGCKEKESPVDQWDDDFTW